jgi:hypothetical protein
MAIPELKHFCLFILCICPPLTPEPTLAAPAPAKEPVRILAI